MPTVLPGAEDTSALSRVPLQGGPAAPTGRHLHAVPDRAPLDFDAAVRRLTPRLQRYAVRRLGDAHEAEELVQEALLRAYQHRERLATEDDVAAWTTCVTGRLVVDRLRVRGRSTPVAEVPDGPRSERDTADVVVARDAARTALDALDAMPPRQAAVLWAREVEGLGYDALGTRFGMTEPAVRSLLTRARKSLRAEYAARGGTLPAGGTLAVLAPWAAGTGWLERLRATLGRAAAPAALGIAAAGVVSGVLVGPPSADTVPGTPAVGVTSAAPTAVASPAGAPPVAPGPAAQTGAAAVPAVAAAAPQAAERPRSLAGRALAATVEDTCVEAGGAGAGGTGCAPDAPVTTLSVQVPVTPVDVPLGTPALQSNLVTCADLPDVPGTRCTDPHPTRSPEPASDPSAPTGDR